VSDEDSRTGGPDATGEGAGDDTAGSRDTRRMPTLEKNPGTVASAGAPGDSGLEQDSSAAAYTPGSGGGGTRAARFWSTRRLPAALVALVLLAGTGLLLYDVVAVRLDRPGMAWRRRLAEEFAARPLDDVWVVVGAAVAAALGLLLLLSALSPGLRGLLPMRREATDLRAALGRGAAALVLRDRAMQVSGVQSAKVKVGRRRVRARAECHFRELDEVRAELDSALEDGIRQLGVARRHRLHVRVRRAKR
jgi:hypothetical protein